MVVRDQKHKYTKFSLEPRNSKLIVVFFFIPILAIIVKSNNSLCTNFQKPNFDTKQRQDHRIFDQQKLMYDELVLR